MSVRRMPEVHPADTADEEKFDCPKPWYLALLTVAMSAMTSITVAGALFFLLAAPEKVSPHCYKRTNFVARTMCTASTVCFWTYPVVCCLFVVLLYAKNLVDQRLYYEFLLHKVIIGYGRVQAWKLPVVLMLLLYALCAFSALIWHSLAQSQMQVSHVYSSLAYVTPIISFLAVILAQWSIQGKLITLPNFLEDYKWAISHLNTSHSYPLEKVHAGYQILEIELEKTDEHLDTATMVALVEHYTKAVANTRLPTESDDIEDAFEGTSPKMYQRQPSGAKEQTQAAEVEAWESVVAQGLKQKEYVYWQVRLLFNPRLQDERSQSFRNWALAYMVTVLLAVMLSVYLYICCFVTCLEIERVLIPGTPLYLYAHSFSLRPDLQQAESSHQSFKHYAASLALSFIDHGARAFYSRATGAVPHFQLGAAA